MASITWPSTLPAPLQDGYGEEFPDNRLSWKPDAGPTHIRLRNTSSPYPLKLSYHLTRAQIITLRDFFQTTAAGGISRFNFTHPRTETTVEARFSPDYNPPDVSALQHEAVVSVSLEVMP